MKLTLTEDAPELPVAQHEVIGDKYRVDHVLAHGGMGIICAGEHVELQQRVAIKFIRPELLTNPDLVEGFLLEARTAAALTGPHGIRVMDVGQLSSGMPYMVMEYLEGSDLQTRLEREGPVPQRDAIRYGIQLCEALSEAHAAGIVHRDIKPENLFISINAGRRCTLKVLDFGIAIRKVNHSTHRQRPAEVVGSPWYMSPEQISAPGSVDARTDIWSVGVVLFEMLSGHLPFEGAEVEDVCKRVLHDTPTPVEELVEGIEPRLASVITRCLQKDPAARYDRVSEVAEALEECLLVPSTRTPRAQALPTAPAPSAIRPTAKPGTEGSGVPSSTPPPVATSIAPPSPVAAAPAAPSLSRAALAAVAILLSGWGVSVVRNAPVNPVNKTVARWLSPVELLDGPPIEVGAVERVRPEAAARGITGTASSTGLAVRAEREHPASIEALREATRAWRARTAARRRQRYAEYLQSQGWTPVREVLAELQTTAEEAAESAEATATLSKADRAGAPDQPPP